jgi:hypothetical protein
VKNANEAKRKNETDMTLLLDDWSNARNDSVMRWMLRMRRGSAQVLGLTNISSSHHTAVNLAGAHLFVAFENDWTSCSCGMAVHIVAYAAGC